MKKTLIALAAITLSGVAHAQSSVTLYGDIDTGIRYQTHNWGATANSAPAGVQTANSGAGNLLYMPVGGMQLNYFGLRGSEDLGGGTKAIFDLQNRFNVSNGQFNTPATNDGGLFREAYMGLQGGFGRVTLGRQATPAIEVMATTYGPFSGNSINLYKPEVQQFGAGNGGALVTSSTSYWDGIFASNSLKYYASASGVTLGLMYGLGEQAGSSYNLGATFSAGLKYANGPFSVGAAYQQVTSVTGAAGTGALNAGTVGNIKFKTYTAGGAYTTNNFRVNVGYIGRSAPGVFNGILPGAASASIASTTSITYNNAGNHVNSNMFFGGVDVYASPAVTVGGQLWYTRSDDLSENGKISGALVAKYNFSKRTYAYLESDYTLRAPKDGISTPASGSTNVSYVKPFGIMLGINHKF